MPTTKNTTTQMSFQTSKPDGVDWAPGNINFYVGNLSELEGELGKLKGSRALVLPLGNASIEIANEIANITRTVMYLTSSHMAKMHNQELELLVEALTPKAPPTPQLLEEARMTAAARDAVINNADWLTAAQVSELAGFSVSNPSAQPSKWKKDRRIFAVSLKGVDYFPGYGLDKDSGYTPIKHLKEIIEIFKDSKDAWGMAYWFASVNGYLGGKRPLDVLQENPDMVVAAAQDEVMGVEHG